MRILFMGLGSIGKRHVELLRRNFPDAELLSVRSGKNPAAAGVIEGVTALPNTAEAYLLKPDIVFITNPTSMHIDTAIEAAQHGCHLFIEKPLSHSLDGLEKLLDICRNKGLITLMGCNMRFNPVITQLRELIQSGQLGKLLHFDITCGSYLPEWRPAQDYRNSYSARKELGGGVVLDLIHELDYAFWLFREFAEFRSIVSKISNLEIATEDIAEAVIRTTSGTIGHIHLDYYRRVPRRDIEIVFANGSAHGDLINNRVSKCTGGKTEYFTYDNDRNTMYEKQLMYFIDCVKSGKQTFNDIETGMKILEYALKIKGDNQ